MSLYLDAICIFFSMIYYIVNELDRRLRLNQSISPLIVLAHIDDDVGKWQRCRWAAVFRLNNDKNVRLLQRRRRLFWIDIKSPGRHTKLPVCLSMLYKHPRAHPRVLRVNPPQTWNYLLTEKNNVYEIRHAKKLVLVLFQSFPLYFNK